MFLSVFPFDVGGRVWDLIQSVPEVYLLFKFVEIATGLVSKINLCTSSKVQVFTSSDRAVLLIP